MKSSEIVRNRSRRHDQSTTSISLVQILVQISRHRGAKGGIVHDFSHGDTRFLADLWKSAHIWSRITNEVPHLPKMCNSTQWNSRFFANRAQILSEICRSFAQLLPNFGQFPEEIREENLAKIRFRATSGTFPDLSDVKSAHLVNHDQWVIELSKIHFSRKSDPTRL